MSLCLAMWFQPVKSNCKLNLYDCYIWSWLELKSLAKEVRQRRQQRDDKNQNWCKFFPHCFCWQRHFHFVFCVLCFPPHHRDDTHLYKPWNSCIPLFFKYCAKYTWLTFYIVISRLHQGARMPDCWALSSCEWKRYREDRKSSCMVTPWLCPDCLFLSLPFCTGGTT